MRKYIGIFISILVVCALACSCARRPKTIPQKKMKEIYKEMFLADQWLTDNPDKRAIADTTWFYKPILEKYGYTLDDYYHTVTLYLEDPKRFADMMEEVSDMFSSESDRFMSELEKEVMKSDQQKAGKTWRSSYHSNDLKVITKGYKMTKQADSVWYPKPIVEDTVFSGPEMYIEALPSPEPDTLKPDIKALELPKPKDLKTDVKVLDKVKKQIEQTEEVKLDEDVSSLISPVPAVVKAKKK